MLVDNRFGEANPIPDPAADPGRDDLRPRRAAPARVRRRERRPGDDPRLERHPGDPDGPRRRDHELLVGRPDRLRALAEARHLGARPRRALVDAAGDDRLDVLGLRRHVDGDAARRRRRGAAAAAAPGLDAVAGQVGADVDRRRRPGATRRARRRRRCCSRAPGSRTCSTADDPKVFTDPQSLSFERIDVSTGAQRDVDAADRLRRRRRRRERGRSRSRRRRRRPASRSTCRARSRSPRAATSSIPVVVRAAANAVDRRELRLRRAHRQRRHAPRPVRVPRRAPGAPQRAGRRR